MPCLQFSIRNGLGTFFGTLGGNVKAFSPVGKGGGSAKNPLKNVLTNPGKRGTGYGWVDMCLNANYCMIVLNMKCDSSLMIYWIYWGTLFKISKTF